VADAADLVRAVDALLAATREQHSGS